MDIGAGIAYGIVGMIAGVPAAAVSLSVPPEGPPRWPRSWPRGAAFTAVVAGCAGAAGLVGARVGWTVATPGLALIAVVGVALAVVDLRVSRLPYAMSGATYGIAAVSLTADAVIMGRYTPLVRAVIAAAVVAAVFLVVALILAGQLGLGDVVMLGWIGLTLGWVGWRQLGVGILAGFVAQLAVLAVLAIARILTAQAMGCPTVPIRDYEHADAVADFARWGELDHATHCPPDAACHQAAALSAAGDEVGFQEFIDRYRPAL